MKYGLNFRIIYSWYRIIVIKPGQDFPKSDVEAKAFKGICLYYDLISYVTVKLFPTECFGGVTALKLYDSAFRGMRFLPTGGITLDNYVAKSTWSTV